MHKGVSGIAQCSVTNAHEVVDKVLILTEAVISPVRVTRLCPRRFHVPVLYLLCRLHRHLSVIIVTGSIGLSTLLVRLS